MEAAVKRSFGVFLGIHQPLLFPVVLFPKLSTE